jgi:hypothetical protein
MTPWIYLAFAVGNVGYAAWYAWQLLGAAVPPFTTTTTVPRWRDVINHAIIAALWVWIYRLS